MTALEKCVYFYLKHQLIKFKDFLRVATHSDRPMGEGSVSYPTLYSNLLARQS